MPELELEGHIDVDHLLHQGFVAHAAHQEEEAKSDFAIAARILDSRFVAELNRRGLVAGMDRFDQAMASQRLGPGLGGAVDRIRLAPGNLTFGVAHLVSGTIVFDAATGEPRDWLPWRNVSAWATNDPKTPLLMIGARSVADAIYDPATLGTILDATAILGPIADKAYVLEGLGCHWHVWSMSKRAHLGDLDVPASPDACEGNDSPFLSADGKWLGWANGRWSLATHHFHPYPKGYARAASHDGRFVAYFVGAPNAPVLVLHELATGAQKSVVDFGFGGLANSLPLSFSDDSKRLVVLDYTVWTYDVPSMKLISKEPLGPVAPTAPVAETSDEAAAHARLEAHACHVDGVILPRLACQ